ncbi:unnamed protein product (macronuclear) [Paramecium tetraurelia]|uniref:EF-hand domain-containing protein n=1 Tax=Paramecium tetraurelia TaxID=5888 RepID=A0C466_PARTE|nr:uncharacterized protein GSPATT00035063001 [Paramecium tetraurelia]CAK65583.1 unnamed protein product [Paramecium tetraurelia]|eukprot:XP_001432980.1 hypothetical protein (macronuclear) [Paramecium tetraurelia strain d4-2]
MSRQVYVSPERMTIQKLEEYPSALQDLNFNHSRFQEIEAEFKALDVDQSGWLSLAELELHLKRKGCDQQLVQEIFNDLNTNQDQKISKDEFTHGYLNKEQNLKDQVKSLEIKIKQIRTSEDEFKQQINVANHQQLIITLQSGCLNQLYRQQDDIIKASKQIEVLFQCNEASDGHDRFSKLSLNCEYPVWGDKITYILNEVHQIEISVELIEIYQLQKQSLGKIRVQKNLQQDFQNQEQLIFEGIGEILVLFEYINNWNEYIQAQMQFCEENVNNLLEQIRQIKRKLYFMKQLYNFDNGNLKQKETLSLSLLPAYKQDIQINKSFQQQENKAQYDTQPIFNQQQLPQQEQIQIQQIPEYQQDYQLQNNLPDAFNIFKHSESDPDAFIVSLEQMKSQPNFKLMGILVLLITINIAFSRCDFLGLMLVLLSIPYQNRKWNNQQLQFYTYGMIFSLILEFYWIIKFSNCFSNLYQCNNQYGFALSIYFLCLLTFLGKIYVLYKVRGYH